MATEAELSTVRERLFGLIAEEDIAIVDFARPERGLVAGLLGLTDLCSTISDALDDLGVGAAISGSVLVPRDAGARVCGPAVTIRYAREGGSPGALAAIGQRARLADRDVYAVGRPGDVAVFDCGGSADASVVGGLSARWARQLGMAACVVDGAVRDLASIEREGLPIWSRGVTPQSGKLRMRALEINGTVSLAGETVAPGDLVAADSSGVCLIPSEAAAEVLAICLEADRVEAELIAAINEGSSLVEIRALLPPERW